MREPMVRRRHTRQQQLLRYGIAAVAVVVVAAILGLVLGGGNDDKGDLPVAEVEFSGSDRAESDDGTVPAAKVQAEGTAIRTMLDSWYQVAFVDPARYGDGAFQAIEAFFAKEAKASFRDDLSMLTIGDAFDKVKRMDPERARADVSVFFAKGADPTFAVATIRFVARATLADEEALPLRIDQRLTLHLEKGKDGWSIVFYEGKQARDFIRPSPTGSPTS